MEKALPIHSVYLATEGEGVHIGTPQIFVRLQGCNIGCVNCDSRETWEFVPNNYSINEILAAIAAESINPDFPVKRVSITGGDPLHPKFDQGVRNLVTALKSQGYYLNIEASGTRVVDPLFDQLDFISFDVKTPSTQVETPIRNIIKMLTQYSKKSQIKSVISDKKDFHYVLALKDKLEEQLQVKVNNWFLTPCYEPEYSFKPSISKEVIALNEFFGGPFRVIGQQHKWVFGTTDLRV